MSLSSPGCVQQLLVVQVRVSEYNQVKGQVNQQSRKQTGSLAVRDLAGVVSSKDIISTENLVTVFVVVSKHTKLEWLSSYEKFCEFVVSPEYPSCIGYQDQCCALLTLLALGSVLPLQAQFSAVHRAMSMGWCGVLGCAVLCCCMSCSDLDLLCLLKLQHKLCMPDLT